MDMVRQCAGSRTMEELLDYFYYNRPRGMPSSKAAVDSITKIKKNC